MYVEYDSNNSGGSWWLDDKQWKALEKAGWKVVWTHLQRDYKRKTLCKDGTPALCSYKPNYKGDELRKKGHRWLDALATTAYRAGLSLRDAVNEWETVTRASSTDAGCACCGQPHNFTEYDDKGKWVDSGPSTAYECSW